MNSIFLRIAAASTALAAMMCSCGGTGVGKSLDEISDATSGDSLLYYYGQLHAVHFWDESASDSTLISEQGRESYLRGIEAGLKGIGNDENYNAGLIAGLEIARNIQQFRQDYGVELNPEIIMESLRYSLNEDSIEDEEDISMHFYEILTRLSNQKDSSDRTASEQALAEAAKSQNMQKVHTLLYRKLESEGSGNILKEGDRVNVDLKVSCKGHDIAVPIPKETKVGSPYTNALINEALLSMKEGETTLFITSAYSLFGRKCTQMHLIPSDIISIRITTGSLDNSLPGSGKNNYESQDTPAAL
ncbi:MAG: hypothetical protein K2M67_06585 [Muribaculaceae bacterium]|nr:hypothetical protein [Muribaculaceae bacterium]